MDRMYNVEKSRKRKADDIADDIAVPRKQSRPKRIVFVELRYPAVRQADGPEAEQVNIALYKEMEKEKPRKDVVLSLMKSTFGNRRQYIL